MKLRDVTACKKCGSKKSLAVKMVHANGYAWRQRICPVCRNTWKTIEVDYWDAYQAWDKESLKGESK